MKKGSKPFIAFTLLVSVMLALLFTGYVSIKLNCEEFIREKVVAEETLSSKKNLRINLLAAHQFLSSEERIVDIAVNELKMERTNNPDFELKVSKKKIEETAAKIEAKYD